MNGKLTANWHPVQAKEEQGRFVRQQSSSRNWITADDFAGPTGKGARIARVLRLPGVRETVYLDHVKAGYYPIKALNQSGTEPMRADNVTDLLQATQ
ncbi:hypothetical protein [Fuscibacter oryzae]|uniref:hypothetical protein n=1 Tax=Fuscibacter oryzae TaxID=2803939 RepID=UPI001F2ED4C3|nr:hypothetical protein [Fuscibacter oryzae]